MAGKLEAEVFTFERCSYLKLSGIIDEDNDLYALLERLPGGVVVIDLAAVADINSCGVRDWVRWREELQSRGGVLVLVECSPAVVDKLNTVGNFCEGGFIKSFYVPYHCPGCDNEKAMLVDIDEMHGPLEEHLPICRCDTCDSVMAFDDLAQSYLAFVGEARGAQPPGEIGELLERFSTAGGERKAVSGKLWGGSSFSGIPSSISRTEHSGIGGGGSLASLGSLRRIKGRSSVGAAGGEHRQRAWRPLWLVLACSVVLLLVAILLALRL